MAESKRKIADPIELDDQDPFAELTRIMGFDPRVAAKAPVKESPASAANEDLAPAARAAPAAVDAAPASMSSAAAQPAVNVVPVSPPAAAPDLHDDFGIDLEKELLGGFDDFEAPQPAPVAIQPAPAAVQPAPAVAQPDPVSVLPEAVPVSVNPEPVQPPVVAQAPAAKVELQAPPVADPASSDFQGALEEAFASLGVATMEKAGAAAPAPRSADNRSAAEDELVAGFDFDDLDLTEISAHPTPQPVAAVSEAPAADLNLGKVERDVPAPPEVEWVPQPAVAPAAVDARQPLDFVEIAHDDRAAQTGWVRQPAAPVVPAAGPKPLLDLSLDDFDFDEAVAAAHPAPKAEAAARPRPELDLDLDSFDFDVPASEPAAVAVAPALPVAAAPAMRQPEPVAVQAPVDDGLAEVDMDFSAAFDQEFAASEPVAQAADDPVDTWDVRPAAPAPAEPEISFEDEIEALLSRDSRHSTQPSEPVAAMKPVLHTPLPYDTSWAALEAQDERGAVAPVSAAAAGTSRRSFSDPALIARHANFQAPPKPLDDLDDLLKAMEHETHVEHPPAPLEPYGRAAPIERVEITYDDAPGEQAAGEGAADPYGYYEEEPATAYGGAPDVETVEVPEAAVAVAHDLDIPELAYEDERPQAPLYDDIDADFSAAFQDSKPSEEPVNQIVRETARPSDRAHVDLDFDSLYGPRYADAGRPAHEGTVVPFQAAGYRQDQQRPDFDDFDIAGQQPAGQDRFADFDFDEDNTEIPPAHAVTGHREQPRLSRGLLIAAVVGGVAVLGGVGALALSFGGGDSANAPAVVKADESPIKVKPENPGGTSVPNQDNKVYDAVKGTAANTQPPTQEKLVTTSEEPVDMAAAAENGSLPGVNADEDIIPKTDERIEPSADDEVTNEGAVVAPRKVKTMVVRSDGTLVPREEAPAPKTVAADENTGTVAAADAVPVQPVKTSKVKTAKVAAADADAQAQETSALPPAKKADDQKTEEVAAIEPAATAAAGAWSVQIASQPSAEAAKSSYEDLAKRYAGVIGGKGVNIVKAEIAGKGTYWRVRVPAPSRDDAVKLCNDYKAAGGNCFISK